MASTAGVPRPNERFLRTLTPEMRRQVLSLATLLNESSGDFVIFTARKSVCIADALRRLGYWRADGDYVSNRALDGDLSELEGRDVLIVEDLAASCRTLARMLDIVRSARAARIRCFALSVEGPRQTWEDLLGQRFEDPYLDSDIAGSIRHAHGIIDALAALPRPYNIDWPTHAYQRDAAVAAREPFGWRRLQALEAQGPTSFEPSPEVLSAAVADLSQEVVELLIRSHLTKVRIYPVRDPQPEGTHAFIVPVVALGVMTHAEITDALVALAAAVGAPPPPAVTPTGGYRLLQYCLGELLLTIFARCTGEIPPVSDGSARYLFMPDVRRWVDRVTRAVHAWEQRTRARTLSSVRPVDVVTWQQRRAADEQLLAAEGVLSEIFLDGYVRSNEYALRQELRRCRDDGCRMEIAQQIWAVERHEDTASFNAGDLRERLRTADIDITDDATVGELVSAFLDRAIDAGEVVPEIVHKDDAVSRRFRPGEIINFERDAQQRVASMLRAYARQSTSNTLPVDRLQKLVVGFIDFLLERGQIEDLAPSGASPRDATRLQRRYHLRGAVLDHVATDFVAPIGPEPLVARKLREAGIVRPSPNGYEIVDPQQRLDGELEASHYGAAIADLLALRDEKGRPVIDDDRHARIVTLRSPLEQALALGADVEIANKPLGIQHLALAAATADERFAQGLNQGLAKARWIMEERGPEAIAKAKELLLSRADEYAYSARESVVESLMPKAGENDASLVVRRLADWLRVAHVLEAFASARELEDDVARAKRIKRRMMNPGFNGCGGLGAPNETLRGMRVGTRLLAAAREGADPGGPGAAQLMEAARGELINLAANLHNRCYELAARVRADATRTQAIRRCLLVRSNGSPCDDLARHPHVERVNVCVNRDGELVLAPFDHLVELADGFDLSTGGKHLIDLLDSHASHALLIEHPPDWFSASRDTKRQSLVVTDGLVDLVAAFENDGPTGGALTVLLPAEVHSPLARTIRAHSPAPAETIQLVGCEWQLWRWTPPGEERQLTLSPQRESQPQSDSASALSGYFTHPPDRAADDES